MKKKFIALMILTALSLTACGGGEQKSSEAPAVQLSSSEAPKPKSSEASSSEVKKADERVFELGKKVEFDTFDITIKSLSIVKDKDGKPALKYVYDWTNKYKYERSPAFSFCLIGSQNGMRTNSDIDDMYGVDLEIEENFVKSGATITAEGVIGIDDMNSPMDIELNKYMTSAWENTSYTMTINDLSALNN